MECWVFHHFTLESHWVRRSRQMVPTEINVGCHGSDGVDMIFQESNAPKMLRFELAHRRDPSSSNAQLSRSHRKPARETPEWRRL